MAGRGTYRGIYSSLLDHPEFHRLTPTTRHVFLTMRLSKQVGPAAIFLCYREVLAQQTGLSMRQVERGLAELDQAEWIRREGPIVWIVNGLRYDPFMRLSNPTQRVAVMRSLEELPRCGLVVSYCQYYRLEWLSDSLSEGSWVGSSMTYPLQSQSQSQSQSQKADTPPTPLTGGSRAPDPAAELLDFLNRKTGHRYRPAASTLALIRARLRSGATADQIRSVIVAKWREWRDRPDMVGFLRPSTLFRASNFESYLGQLPAEACEEI